jgi:nucleotidyltransferase/DNA polymerase involved in DNA repair
LAFSVMDELRDHRFVIDPQQALDLIERLHPIVSHWKVGKVNYQKEIERSVNWVEFRDSAKALLDSYNADYYIKKSLADL